MQSSCKSECFGKSGKIFWTTEYTHPQPRKFRLQASNISQLLKASSGAEKPGIAVFNPLVLSIGPTSAEI